MSTDKIFIVRVWIFNHCNAKFLQIFFSATKNSSFNHFPLPSPLCLSNYPLPRFSANWSDSRSSLKPLQGETRGERWMAKRGMGWNSSATQKTSATGGCRYVCSYRGMMKSVTHGVAPGMLIVSLQIPSLSTLTPQPQLSTPRHLYLDDSHSARASVACIRIPGETRNHSFFLWKRALCIQWTPDDPSRTYFSSLCNCTFFVRNDRYRA